MLHQRMPYVVAQSFRVAGFQSFRGDRFRWQPPTDVIETTEHLIVMLEVAGIEPDQCTANLENGVLRIAGLRHHPIARMQFHHMEIAIGAFEVIVHLGMNAPASTLTLRYDRGFLIAQLQKVNATPSVD